LNPVRFFCHRQRFTGFLETGSLHPPPAAHRLFPRRREALLINVSDTSNRTHPNGCVLFLIFLCPFRFIEINFSFSLFIFYGLWYNAFIFFRRHGSHEITKRDF